MVLLTKDQIGHFLKPLDVFGNTPNLRAVSEIYKKKKGKKWSTTLELTPFVFVWIK